MSAVPVPDPARSFPRRARRLPEIVRRRLEPWQARGGWSWAVAAVVTLIAAIVRLVDLDRPGHIIFDETYYAPNAYALLRYGVEWQVAEDGANPVDGAPVFGDGPAYVVHPPLGKWMIAAGEWVFGYNPYGWRIGAALVGIATVLMITRIGRRMFGSTALGAVAGLLMAFDGMHVVLSRTALLDGFLTFFVVAAFGALVLDRDRQRRRWWEAVAAGRRRPPAGWRQLPWWRFAAAALLGGAVSVKWSAAFFIPVFVGLVIVWEVSARRSAGVRRPWRHMVRTATGSLAVSALIVPVVYVASWIGWFATDHGYLRHWRAETDQSEPPVLGALLNLIHYHRQALEFHLPLDSSHPYESSPWQWLLLARPVAFHWDSGAECGADSCVSTVLLLGTPALWWSFLPALGMLVWFGIARRDWRAGAIGLSALAGFAPWFLFDDRVMFYFYAVPAEPFLVLAVAYVWGALAAPSGNRLAIAGPAAGTLANDTPGDRVPLLGIDRRTLVVLLAGAYVGLVALNFAYFYPIYTGLTIPYEAWQARMWLPSWV